jgi:hypothetical protein
MMIEIMQIPDTSSKVKDMPRHPDFEKIYQAFMWRYCQDKTECDTGKQHYYSWLSKLGLDDTKPYQSPQERFSWTEPYIKFLKEDEEAKYFKVEALFPLSSMNNNLYTQDELSKACRTLIGKTINLNHTDEVFADISITDADYEDSCVECLLRVPKQSRALGLIEKGEIVHVSIEADCLRGSEQTPEGNVCKGLVFTGLALLTKDILPGVPLTRITSLEHLIESFTVTGVTNLDENEIKDQSKTAQGEERREATVASTPEQKQVAQQEPSKPTLDLRVTDLEKQLAALKSEFDTLKKPKEEPKPQQKKEPCKCIITKEGFWQRFHQLRSEGLSKSDAFRLVSLEVIEASTKTEH